MAKQEQIHKSTFSRQMSQKYIESKEPDVHFIFEEEGKTVKIPAHKDLLAVASSVFDAMFNGELKEKGDVKITDASSTGFKEFLQFFYDDEVKMTMENIADVLNLAHKYDISEVINAAVEFIKKKLTTDKTMWCLQLAIKYQLDELKAFCKEMIAKDPMNALDGSVGDGTGEMDSPAEKQELLSTIVILMEALSITKEIIYKQSTKLKRSKNVIPVILSKNDIYKQRSVWSSEENTRISATSASLRLWLSEIYFVDVFTGHDAPQTIPLKGTVKIKRADSSAILFTREFGTNSVEKYIKLPEPIEFEANVQYEIRITPSVYGYPHATASQNTSANHSGQFRVNCDGFTLIDRLHFVEESEL